MSDIEAKRAARRAAMPIVSSIVDELERDGLSPRVIYASENGITVGKRPEYAEVFEIPRGYLMPSAKPKDKK